MDEETWLLHLRAGDYSRWMREVIKDDDLAREVGDIESGDLAAPDSVRLVRDAIERRYVHARRLQHLTRQLDERPKLRERGS